MKILMVSIFAPHFFNWTEQLKDSGHEIYWLDVFDSNTHVEKIDFVHQIRGWRYKWDYPGRYFIKSRLPKLNELTNRFNQRDLAEFFEKKVREIKPDIVQSFVLQSGAYPIVSVMKKNPDLAWIYSSWGSDLYYRKQDEKELIRIRKTLPNFHYLFTDCLRDYGIAKENGFDGTFLGAYPGGGGYDLKVFNELKQNYQDRNIILIKGYQGNQGQCNSVLEAIKGLKNKLFSFEIIVFASNHLVESYIKENGLDKWENFSFLNRIPHRDIMKLMGNSRIYIGNSLSDGMPNTLLEAIVMGAYPIQSNPGGATAELISDGNGGLLIKDPLNPIEISEKIMRVINNPERVISEIEFNNKEVRPLLNREKLKNDILFCYKMIEKELKNGE